jgi:hypothetical protein
MRQVAWTFLILAGGATFMHSIEVAAFLVFATIATFVASIPSQPHRDARRRNHAHRVVR